MNIGSKIGILFMKKLTLVSLIGVIDGRGGESVVTELKQLCSF
jgi:hypothetical protein